MIHCRMCSSNEPDGDWIIVSVLASEPDSDSIAGAICSPGCLIDYAAAVRELELKGLSW